MGHLLGLLQELFVADACLFRTAPIKSPRVLRRLNPNHEAFLLERLGLSAAGSSLGSRFQGGTNGSGLR
jgi:hypothetical protein